MKFRRSAGQFRERPNSLLETTGWTEGLRKPVELKRTALNRHRSGGPIGEWKHIQHHGRLPAREPPVGGRNSRGRRGDVIAGRNVPCFSRTRFRPSRIVARQLAFMEV